MTEASQPAAVPPAWTLGDRLRKARETAGLKQSEIADEIGIGRTSVVNYESGKKQPSRPVLLSWALRTRVPYQWLTGEPEFRARRSTSALTYIFASWAKPRALAA